MIQTPPLLTFLTPGAIAPVFPGVPRRPAAPRGGGPAEAAEVCLRKGGPPPSEESAREKVIFCNAQGDTLVYQANRAKSSAALCACGNASGASAALLAR